MNETAQSRARRIWQAAKNNPVPVPIIEPSRLCREDYGAHGMGGHWAHVSCDVRESTQDVIAFIERNTKLDGWIIRIGSPYLRNGKWNWQLIRHRKG